MQAFELHLHQSCWLVECCFTSTDVGLLGMGAQDRCLDFHTAPELCAPKEFSDIYNLWCMLQALFFFSEKKTRKKNYISNQHCR